MKLLGGVLVAVPVLAALLGPLVAGDVRAGSAPLLAPSGAHLLGTDVLGRDVLALALTGGGSVLALAGSALVLAYAAGVPLALMSVGHRWAERVLTRTLDLVLALPGLLVLMVLAATGRRTAGALIAAVAVLELPAVVRLVRGAAAGAGRRQAVEAMRMQGEPWWRVRFGYLGRCALGPIAVDAGNRLVLVLYLISSANFLGLGLDPATADWAVLVERNREALFLQPAAVLVPAGLLVALCAGTNLLVDRRLAGRDRLWWGVPPPSRTRPHEREICRGRPDSPGMCGVLGRAPGGRRRCR